MDCFLQRGRDGTFEAGRTEAVQAAAVRKQKEREKVVKEVVAVLEAKRTELKNATEQLEMVVSVRARRSGRQTEVRGEGYGQRG